MSPGNYVALAVILSWIIARTDCPFRNQLEFLLILSFFFPLLGKVLGWALLLSPQKGYLNQLLVERRASARRRPEGCRSTCTVTNVIFPSSSTCAPGGR